MVAISSIRPPQRGRAGRLDQIDRRPRRERRELLEELHQLEEQVRRPVAPRPLQPHSHAAVAEQPQPSVGQWRAEEVAAQLPPTRRAVLDHVLTDGR